MPALSRSRTVVVQRVAREHQAVPCQGENDGPSAMKSREPKRPRKLGLVRRQQGCRWLLNRGYQIREAG